MPIDRLFYELFFEICRATLSVRLHYEVGSCEVGELRSGGVLLRSGQLRSGRITKWWGPLTKWAITKWGAKNYEVVLHRATPFYQMKQWQKS